MRHLNIQQLDAILSAAKGSARDQLMMRVAYNHGLRAIEVVSLTKENVRDGFLIVQRKKKSLKTTQPLLENEYGLMQLAKETEGRLFPISRVHFWRLMQKYGAKAGIPQHLCHPHALKHATAMTALDGGIKINELQQYLGHKSGASTMMYLRVHDDLASAAFSKAIGVPSNESERVNQEQF